MYGDDVWGGGVVCRGGVCVIMGLVVVLFGFYVEEVECIWVFKGGLGWLSVFVLGNDGYNGMGGGFECYVNRC